VTLIDTGPLVALLNPRDPMHPPCRAAATTLSGPLVTTWPVLTEAWYLLWKGGGWPAQAHLWQRVLEGALQIGTVPPDLRVLREMQALMARYHELPMDVADASLVILARRERQRHSLLTLDHHFELYRELPRQTTRMVVRA
jgi:uncharacterized protein